MIRMCDYDRLHYDDQDQPGTATVSGMLVTVLETRWVWV